MSESKYVFPRRLKTSYEGEATKVRSSKPRDIGIGTAPYRGLPKKRASDGPSSQWLLLYPLRPSVDTDLIREEMRAFGACRTVRSDDGYYAICEYEAKADAVRAKTRLHHSREPWVLRKEHATGYWAHKAATGLKIDSVSRPKALECLAKLGFPVFSSEDKHHKQWSLKCNVAGFPIVDGGWDSVLLKPKKGPRLSDFYRERMSRIYEAEERAKNDEEAQATRKEETRRRRRVELGLPDYDSFDEDLDFPEVKESDRDMRRRCQIRSQLGLPDYDSFDEDL